jgi:response regulator NasT
MSVALKIAIADDERETREFLHEAVVRLGHEVVVEVGDGRRLTEQCKITKPDLILADIKMPGMDGLDAAIEVNRDRPTPVVLISGHHEDAVLNRIGIDSVMAYLVKPIKEVDLKTAIAVARSRFQQYLGVAKEAAELRQALEDRKLVERAKGTVMRRLHIDEEEAFRRLRKFASDHNRKLVDVAAKIVASEEVFHQLEQP